MSLYRVRPGQNLYFDEFPPAGLRRLWKQRNAWGTMAALCQHGRDSLWASAGQLVDLSHPVLAEFAENQLSRLEAVEKPRVGEAPVRVMPNGVRMLMDAYDAQLSGA